MFLNFSNSVLETIFLLIYKHAKLSKPYNCSFCQKVRKNVQIFEFSLLKSCVWNFMYYECHKLPLFFIHFSFPFYFLLSRESIFSSYFIFSIFSSGSKSKQSRFQYPVLLAQSIKYQSNNLEKRILLSDNYMFLHCA